MFVQFDEGGWNVFLFVRGGRKLSWLTSIYIQSQSDKNGMTGGPAVSRHLQFLQLIESKKIYILKAPLCRI